MRGIRGIGLQGLMNPIFSSVCLGGLNPWNFDPTLVSMTVSLAKRATSVFAASPIVQGGRNGTGTPDTDSISTSLGSLIASRFYPYIDCNQGSIVFRITPEWNGNDGIQHTIFSDQSTGFMIIKDATSKFRLHYSDSTGVDASGWIAGTTYNVCVSWDTKYSIDGTNDLRYSINDTHTFRTAGSAVPTVTSTLYFGSRLNSAADALIEGLTIYRRVLYDGTYGVNVGNGDEIALIAAGVDPTTITGSWDVCFCMPTNASTGALTTGTGNAWSHPHSSNLVTRGFLSDRYYGGTNQWGVKFNGTSSYINCGSGATLDDLLGGGATFQAEFWYRELETSNRCPIAKGINVLKGYYTINNGSGFVFYVRLETTSVAATYAGNFQDGKWHHYTIHYDDTTKIGRVSVDGVWGNNSNVGVGAYVSDAGYSLIIGSESNLSYWFIKGSIGWVRIHNHAHYTPGTNFVPSRTFPGVDAGTVEAWVLNEGTGTTATASVTSPANNGTISNGTWEQQWLDEGTPVMLQSVTNVSGYSTNLGSGATIDDLADNAFTAEGWFKFPVGTTTGVFMGKGTYNTSGWFIYISGGALRAKVECATTDAISYRSGVAAVDSLWHHLMMTFDDAGDRKVRLYIDGVEITYTSQTAGVGAILSDAGLDGSINTVSGLSHGWIRWSNVVRGAGMIPRSNPPAVDGNTVAQWNATDGAGSTLTDSSGNANHGTMAGTYSWNNTPAMEVDSPGARQYAWGYVIGSDAANEGVKQLYSGLTAGSNYVLNAWAYSEDGVAQPGIVVCDETNSTTITSLSGTTTSTERAPDRLNLSFKLPTIATVSGIALDCTSISLKLLNLTASGVVGWQQVELLPNLLNNPSMDTGAVADPWIPYFWTNLNLVAGDASLETVNQHSGSGCVRYSAACASRFHASPTITMATGKFYSTGAWFRGDGTTGSRLYAGGTGTRWQRSVSNNYDVNGTILDAWKLQAYVVRQDSTVNNPRHGGNSGAVGNRYIDDEYWFTLDDATLTCTPASAANSVESSGIRVDGYDKSPQVIPENSIFANQGWVKFAWTPRHSAADVAKFGNATPAIAQIYGDADDYITLDWSAANTIRLSYNANGAGVQTGTWNATGAIVAGTTYQMEIKYLPTGMELIVDGTSRITITADVAFGTVPTSFYPGSLQSGSSQVDAVFLAPS